MPTVLSFFNMTGLKNHQVQGLEGQHTPYKGKIFSCAVCERRFTNIGKFNRHKMVHTGERPYSCDVCSRAFALEYNLTAHKKIHSNTKEEVL